MSYPEKVNLNGKIYKHDSSGIYKFGARKTIDVLSYDMLLDLGGVDVSNEWPQVGDEVITNSGRKAKILGKHKGNLWIEYSESEIHNTICESDIRKPKTPEEELRDELMEMATTAMSDKSFDLAHNCYYLVSGLMHKYKIEPRE